MYCGNVVNMPYYMSSSVVQLGVTSFKTEVIIPKLHALFYGMKSNDIHTECKAAIIENLFHPQKFYYK